MASIFLPLHFNNRFQPSRCPNGILNNNTILELDLFCGQQRKSPDIPCVYAFMRIPQNPTLSGSCAILFQRNKTHNSNTEMWGPLSLRAQSFETQLSHYWNHPLEDPEFSHTPSYPSPLSSFTSLLPPLCNLIYQRGAGLQSLTVGPVAVW